MTAAQRAHALATAILADGLDRDPTLLRHGLHVAVTGLSGMARNGVAPHVAEVLLAEVAAALDLVGEDS